MGQEQRRGIGNHRLRRVGFSKSLARDQDEGREDTFKSDVYNRYIQGVQQTSTRCCEIVGRRLNVNARMAESADAADSKSAGLRSMGVQLPLRAPLS
jgi:hypothetical protein